MLFPEARRQFWSPVVSSEEQMLAPEARCGLQKPDHCCRHCVFAPRILAIQWQDIGYRGLNLAPGARSQLQRVDLSSIGLGVTKTVIHHFHTNFSIKSAAGITVGITVGITHGLQCRVASALMVESRNKKKILVFELLLFFNYLR